jgi:hypothetical protein
VKAQEQLATPRAVADYLKVDQEEEGGAVNPNLCILFTPEGATLHAFPEGRRSEVLRVLGAIAPAVRFDRPWLYATLREQFSNLRAYQRSQIQNAKWRNKHHPVGFTVPQRELGKSGTASNSTRESVRRGILKHCRNITSLELTVARSRQPTHHHADDYGCIITVYRRKQ